MLAAHARVMGSAGGQGEWWMAHRKHTSLIAFITRVKDFITTAVEIPDDL